jgi:cell division inhibitor SepF
MGALRRAGVWLGLVEEDERHGDGIFDDEFDDDDFAPASRARSLPRARVADRDARPVERDVPPERDQRDLRSHRGPAPDRDASALRADRRTGAEVRIEHELRTDRDARPDRADRSSVRHLGRHSGPQSSTVGYPTQDNLALAPQVQLRERAVVGEETKRYQITTLHPTTYSEARAIGEHFRDGYPVIMNLTEMDEPDAKRLVDFAAGLAFGLRGSMERVTNRVFLLSPANIQVSAEDKARIAEGGFFNQA